MNEDLKNYYKNEEYDDMKQYQFCKVAKAYNPIFYDLNKLEDKIKRAFNVQLSRPKLFKKRIDIIYSKILDNDNVVKESVIEVKPPVITDPEPQILAPLQIPEPVIDPAPIKFEFPTQMNPDIELQKMRNDLVKGLISEIDLKTEVTQSERIILTNLEDFASQPFKNSVRIANDRGIPYDYNKCKLEALKNFCIGYMRKGKALNRKGIKEDVTVMSGLFKYENEVREHDRERRSDVHK